MSDLPARAALTHYPLCNVRLSVGNPMRGCHCGLAERLLAKAEEQAQQIAGLVEQGFVQHKEGCEKRRGFFGMKSNGCKRCFGSGYIPSETCTDCVDCQDVCPECHGRQPETNCTCGLADALARLTEPKTC